NASSGSAEQASRQRPARLFEPYSPAALGTPQGLHDHRSDSSPPTTGTADRTKTEAAHRGRRPLRQLGCRPSHASHLAKDKRLDPVPRTVPETLRNPNLQEATAKLNLRCSCKTDFASVAAF